MLRVAVRDLAEFVHRRGDLHARLDGRTRSEEGIAAQKALQQGRAGSYQRERAVSLTVTLAGLELTLGGRIDGCDLACAPVLVEEFKATRADADAAHAHQASAHWAQVRLYAALLARELDAGGAFELRLVYCHPRTLHTRTFRRQETAADVLAFLETTLESYGRWLAGQQAHVAWRDGRLRDLGFPYPAYRRHQRTMARRVFRALRDREHLLLEAPTGSGKTAATLFPALRALEACDYRRVLFLTSRTTGALAVRDAARRMDPAAGFLRQATITAREKACLMPGTPCEPDACPYARGYYDRARAAVVELLERRVADPETIADVARAHRVCPFELSLDTASWCDLVVADYNYVFDPVVRLQRFANDSRTLLLVDESHQLAPRVRDMLSLVFRRRDVREALGEGPPEPLAARLRSLDRALVTLRREQALGGEEQVLERPNALIRSMQRFAEAVAETETSLEALPATREVVFGVSRWLRSDAWYDPRRFVHLGVAEGRDVTVRFDCLDPGPYIRARFDEHGGHVRFSGTVSPLDLYASLHGEPDGPAERSGNPFQPEQLRVLVVDDVPTVLRRRRQSAPAVADLVRRVAAARDGHYLVAFPSFEYLDLVADAWRRSSAARCMAGPRLQCQTPGMSDADRTGFLDALGPDSPACLAFVVLGGVFGESVDFPDASLSGVVCVGVGLPPPSLTRTALSRYFDSRGLDGAAVAYHQPAMVKVLQMAGRLLRSVEDRGVLCLVDARFRHLDYQRFFPDHWRPAPVRAHQVGDALARFWSAGG